MKSDLRRPIILIIYVFILVLLISPYLRKLFGSESFSNQSTSKISFEIATIDNLEQNSTSNQSSTMTLYTESSAVLQQRPRELNSTLMGGRVYDINDKVDAYRYLRYLFTRHKARCSNLIAWENHHELMAYCKDIAIEPPCISYTFGVSYDWRIQELFINDTGCIAYTFDPSMNVEDHWHASKIYFAKIGIAGNDSISQGWRLLRLNSIMKLLNHSDTLLDLLYLDCETYEFEVLQDIVGNGDILRIKQIFVEIHLDQRQKTSWTQYARAMVALEKAGFLLVYNRALISGFEMNLGTQIECLLYLNPKFFPNAALI